MPSRLKRLSECNDEAEVDVPQASGCNVVGRVCIELVTRFHKLCPVEEVKQLTAVELNCVDQENGVVKRRKFGQKIRVI